MNVEISESQSRGLVSRDRTAEVKQHWNASMPDSMPEPENTEADPSLARARSTVRRARVMVGLGLAALFGAGLWVIFVATRAERRAGQSHVVRLLTQERPFPLEGRFPRDPYAGPRACSECHPGEAALYSRSGHASTLRAASRLELSRRLDGTTVVDPELPEVSWHYRFRDGQLHIARTARKQVDEFIAEYAFGSGHHATTFVNMIDPDIPAILEHRLTHFTKADRMGITPGHDARPPPPGLTPYGGVLPPKAARGCFACHVTVLSAHDDQRIDEAMMIPNVSCERCHGPGRAHVAAARAGSAESELSLPFGPERWKAAELLNLCGSCHRHPSGSPPGKIRPDDPQLARFQPVGIMQSKCYTESAGALSCVTCHDPHARASADRPSYDSVCISCHRGADKLEPAPGSPKSRQTPVPAAGKECPVSASGRCVECHMPRVDPGQHVMFTDHWIRIRAR
jgi:hypothetical protein